jgi:hypothetical protein
MTHDKLEFEIISDNSVGQRTNRMISGRENHEVMGAAQRALKNVYIYHQI